MGMFSKLFGGSSSDKADKMRQHAIDAFNAIQTPALRDLQIQLDKYVEAGQLTPEQAEAELLGSNAFNDIVTDPALAGAQKQALMALQEVGTQGGLTATDKARLQEITNEQNQVARGRNEAILQSARQKGMGGSDITTINQLLNEQAAADRASQRGTDVAAQAEARALQALMAAGQTAGQIRGQEYGEQANKAQAQNAIDLFNTQTLNQTNLYNVDAANRAQAANLANKQAIMNQNVGTTNLERQYNAQQNQQAFQNEMAKAQGKAGVYNQWAADASAADKADRMADQAFLSGIIQTGATALGGAFGGPAGAAAGSATTQNIGGGKTAMTDPDYLNRMGYADGGMVDPEVKKDDEESENEMQNVVLTGMNRGGEVKMNKGGSTPLLPIASKDNKWTILDPTGEIVGEFDNYSDASMYADKVRQKQPKIEDFRQSGMVPGQAPVEGDHPLNDTVPAKLSPGEVVVPRTAMSDDEEFDAFMEKFRPSRQRQRVDKNIPLEVRALSNLKGGQ